MLIECSEDIAKIFFFEKNFENITIVAKYEFHKLV